MITNKQYEVLLALYHDYNDAFYTLDIKIQQAFFTTLYARTYE